MSTFESLPLCASMSPIEAKRVRPNGTNTATALFKKNRMISLIGIGQAISVFSNRTRSAKFVIIFILLIFTTLTLHAPPVFAQDEPVGTDAGAGFCSLHGNYKGSSCPKCSAAASSTSAPDSSAPSPDSTTDPRQIALQNALPRYNALVHTLSDKYNLLEEKSWLDLALGTEAEFFDGANQLHKLLINRIDAIRFREGKSREDLAYLNEVIETYPGSIAKLRANNERKRLELDRLISALEYGKQQLELTQRAARQFEIRALHYQEQVKRDKETVLSWFAVLLPPSVVKTVSPIPYESIVEPLVGSVPVRERPREALDWSSSAEPLQLRVSKYGIRFEIDPKPLTGTAEDAVAQLEADATAYGTASSRTPMIDAVLEATNRKRPISARLGEEQRNLKEERLMLEGEITTFEGRLKATAWDLLLAQDTLKSERETFLYRAADAWIWQNAKSAAITGVKNEVRRLVAAKTTGVRYRDVTNMEMRASFSTGYRNIFGLSDRIDSFSGMAEVLNRFQILRTHTLGYVEESVRVAALGSPREMLEFVRRMEEGIDEDCKELVKSTLGALKISEPWQSIVAEEFLRMPE